MMDDAAHVARDEILSGVPEGMDALLLARMAAAAHAETPGSVILHVARDDRRLEDLEAALAFFAPDLKVVGFPAWDTVPYDRVSPSPEIVARRITALAKLLIGARKEPCVVLTTVNAILQRLPPREPLRRALRPMASGQRVDMNQLIERLSHVGFVRTGTVMEPGEFAVRGGIVDIFPPGRINPVRLDFFGDTLESIKSFDVETQRTSKLVQRLVLMPISEASFGEGGAATFRARYVELFGGNTVDDPLYQAISAGSRYPGQEHWLPLFHTSLETLFDYAEPVAVSFDAQADEAIRQRFEQIKEHYEARVDSLESAKFGAPPYKPVPPDLMFLNGAEWGKALTGRKVRRFTPFAEDKTNVTSVGAKAGRSFAPERQSEHLNLFPAVVAHIRTQLDQKRRVILAAWTTGARERLEGLLAEHGLKDVRKVASFPEALALPGEVAALAVLGLEHGFETADLAVIAEQDILGDRLVRPRRKPRKAADVITEATSLSVGDLVVHADHGIGRFVGLKAITALGAPHDCLELVYAGGDKLYLPVENIELLSRYGSDSEKRRCSTGSAARPGNRARHASSSACARSPPS